VAPRVVGERTAIKDISNNELRDDTTDALIKVADELGKRASLVVEGIIQSLPATSATQPCL
jgi:hypothetical protein